MGSARFERKLSPPTKSNAKPTGRIEARRAMGSLGALPTPKHARPSNPHLRYLRFARRQAARAGRRSDRRQHAGRLEGPKFRRSVKPSMIRFLGNNVDETQTANEIQTVAAPGGASFWLAKLTARGIYGLAGTVVILLLLAGILTSSTSSIAPSKSAAQTELTQALSDQTAQSATLNAGPIANGADGPPISTCDDPTKWQRLDKVGFELPTDCK